GYDAFAHPGQYRFLARTPYQLVDVGAHGHPCPRDELDTVLGHRRYRWRIDNPRVNGELHSIEHVASRQIDRRSKLKIQRDISLIGGDQGLDYVIDVPSRQIVSLNLVGGNIEAGFCGGN